MNKLVGFSLELLSLADLFLLPALDLGLGLPGFSSVPFPGHPHHPPGFPALRAVWRISPQAFCGWASFFLPGIKLRVYAFIRHRISLPCLLIGACSFNGLWALQSECIAILSSREVPLLWAEGLAFGMGSYL